MAGSLGFDDLTTSRGRRRDLPGGSALYFALGARHFGPVLAAGAVGDDGEPLLRLLDEAGVDRASVASCPGPSYRWRAQHSPGAEVPASEEQALGVYLSWRPRLSPAAAVSPLLFLGSMPPQRQLEVLEQMSSAPFVAIDTMRDFIAWDRPGLERILPRAQLLFANEAEMLELTPDGSGDASRAGRRACRRWGLLAVVLKRGARGVRLLWDGGESDFEARPGVRVVDPTGAGDALAGALMGQLALGPGPDLDAVARGLPAAIGVAALTISDFGTAGLVGGSVIRRDPQSGAGSPG